MADESLTVRRRASTADRRRDREHEIVAATRSLFDERGVRDAQIDDIAKAVGINRAIIYRHFSGKEELFALTLAGYLDELADKLSGADDMERGPVERLQAVVGSFLDFGATYPAFVDCSMALLRRPGKELLREVSEAVIFRLGRSIVSCLTVPVRVLEAGNSTGDFRVEKPQVLANIMYAQAIGGMQLARFRMSVQEVAPGLPGVLPLTSEEVRQYVVAATVAMAQHGSR
jgi:AcrR family transcriptional regulator